MVDDRITTSGAEKDFERFARLSVPTKRAAYSDRTAWLMAVMAELAYTQFDEDSQNALLSMAADLASLADKDAIAERLRELLSLIDRRENAGNQILRNVLAQGDFELTGVLYSAETDTQGFVAVKKPTDGDTGMAVIAFRGTQQVRDWLTNLDAETEDVISRKPGSNVILGKVHRGFNHAFKSVEGQIDPLLKGHEELPLYITGHSLGGALATLATWYLPGRKLAACYTFGAPRVGDTGLMNRYRTPIYRIVNGADPVPMAPPAGTTVNILNSVNWALPFVIKLQGYRHYGFNVYLSICEPGAEGKYPKLTMDTGVSTLGRIWRVVQRKLEGAWTQGLRLDKYHNMSVYREKLRAWAERRQDNLI